MFCPNCGTKLDDTAKFCPNCGTSQSIEPAPQQQTNPPEYAPSAPTYEAPAYEAPTYGGYAGNGAVRQGIPAPGYSDRVDHPEILEAMKNNRRSAARFAFILVPLPLIGFALYSLISGKMEFRQALMIGGFVSVVLLVSAIRTALKERAENTYEATVIDKKSRRTYRHKNDDDDAYYTEYITVVKTAEGKKRKIVEREGSQIWAWDYLRVGDRFLYHPQFHFPYELYDKSKAPYIACVSCTTHNPVEADRCQKCGLPLLK